MDKMKNISEIAINVTTQAAAACYKWIGQKQSDAADLAAVTAMEKAFSLSEIKGKVVIGEGERDKAPMLYIGQELGNAKELEFDIAVDPLEGTNLCAHNLPGALTVIAIGKKGTILQAPDIYMEKIIYSKIYPKNLIHLDNSLENNIKLLAKYKQCDISQIKIILLDRERHKSYIESIIKLGANLTLIQDGDISAAILTSLNEDDYFDLYIGTGGAPEGVLAAAALKTLGGHMQARLVFSNEHEKERATKLGINQLDKIYEINDLVRSDVIFCASGVTKGPLLNGIIYNNINQDFIVESLLINSANNNISVITKTLKQT
jgi:fructose-1,6-bisphosphatase II / sedoheptulose-1,7-bisphosphatase